MSAKLENAKTLPKVYYGLHMAPGVAEYKEPGVNQDQPYRIMIDEDAIKNMDSSFQGRPVYVQHVDEVNLDRLQTDADGYVVESFFNKSDGKHWAKFIVVSDRGHEAIRNGWKLSNAYIPKEMIGGGLWHGVEYAKEVVRGEYEHLAIVPNPRYEESIILTPEQFKAYNSDKEIELNKVANSKGEMSMFQFFKKTKVENSGDLEGMTVSLPKCKKEMTVAQVINAYDEMEKKNEEMAEKPQMANGDHHVMVGDEKMTVNELVEKHLAMKSAKNEDESDADAHAAEGQGEGELKANDEDEEAKKKAKELEEHEAKEIAAKKKNNFDTMKNARERAAKEASKPGISLSTDKVARGKARYGS